MICRVVAAIVLGGLVVAPLAGCTAAREGAPRVESTAASPSPGVNAVDPCDLLAAGAAEALAGEPMTQSSRADVAGIPACHVSGATRRIQVARVPAAEWARTVPALIDQLRSAAALGPANQARLDEVAARIAAGEYEGLKACELFSAMVEFNGSAPGQSRTMTYLPDGRAPQAISAQSCIDGTYTSLLLSGPDIVVSGDIEAAVAATLELIEAD